MRVLTQQKGYIAAILLLAVLAGAEGVLYVSLQSSYISLQSDYSELYNAYSSLQAEKSSLELDYMRLSGSYDLLQIKYKDLEQRYNNCIQDYNSLLGDYNSLLEEYNGLLENYSALRKDYEIEAILRMGNSLASYYDIVRKESGSWQSNAQMVQFAAKLALHSLGRYYWPLLESEFYKNVGKHSYDVAWAMLNAALSLTGATASQDPVERIARILDFIKRHIHYEYDVKDVILAPAETLTFKSGDCDDFTILAAALFEAVGIDSAVALFKHQDPGAEKQYHWMVLVHLDDLGEYSYWYYSDLTSIGLASGKWIKIEPQLTIENQGSEWVGKWSLLAAAPLD